MEQLKTQHARLGHVHAELNSGKPLSAKAGGIMIGAAVQMDQWPSDVSMLYKDATVNPETVEMCGSPNPHGDQDIYPLQIHHQADGSILAGLKHTPRDLQIRIEASALSHVDALVCSLRLVSDKSSQEALRVLLRDTGIEPHAILRELDTMGHPAGPYRFLLQGVKLNLANKLLLMGMQLARQVAAVSSQT